jgi:hypothetical protein
MSPAPHVLPFSFHTRGKLILPEKTLIPPQDSHDVQHMFGFIREICAEAQNTRNSLSEVRKQAEVVDLSLREKQMQDVLVQTIPLFEHHLETIAVRIKALRQSLVENAELHAEYGDAVVNIEHSWKRAALAWLQPDQSSEKALRNAEKVDQALSDIIRQCCMISIPDRINGRLRKLRVGQVLQFHEVFKKDLPELADRQEVRASIAAQPKSVEGLVDVEHGVITRTSPDPRR